MPKKEDLFSPLNLFRQFWRRFAKVQLVPKEKMVRRNGKMTVQFYPMRNGLNILQPLGMLLWEGFLPYYSTREGQSNDFIMADAQRAGFEYDAVTIEPVFSLTATSEDMERQEFAQIRYYNLGIKVLVPVIRVPWTVFVPAASEEGKLIEKAFELRRFRKEYQNTGTKNSEDDMLRVRREILSAFSKVGQ